MGAKVVPFGKYKGQPVEVLQADQDYCEWLSGQTWFRERFPKLQTLIVHNHGEPAETPEHNRLQARFTSDAWANAFCVRLTDFEEATENCREWYEEELAGLRSRLACNYKYRHSDDPYEPTGTEEEAIAHLRELDAKKAHEWELRSARRSVECWAKWREFAAVVGAQIEETERRLAELRPVDTVKVETVAFEAEGADVEIRWHGVDQYGQRVDLAIWSPMGRQIRGSGHERVECKPGMADDYPAVLRQMKSHKSKVLLIGDEGYTGTGATLEQVRKIFGASEITVLFAAEVGE